MKKKNISSKIFYFVFIAFMIFIVGAYYFVTSLKSNTRASENSFDAIRNCYNSKCSATNLCSAQFPALVTSYSDLTKFMKDLSGSCRTCFYRCLSESYRGGGQNNFGGHDSNSGNGGGGGGGPPRQMFLAPTITVRETRYCDPVSKKCMITTCTRTVNIYNSATENCITKPE